VRTPRHLSLLLIAVFGLLAGACADDGELGGPTLGGTPAASIGSFDLGNDDLRDEVEAWAANPALLELIGVTDLGTEGRRTTALTSFVLSHRVVSEQSRLMLADARALVESGAVDLEEVGIDGEVLAEPTDADIDRIIAQLDQQFTAPTGGSIFAVFPEDFRRTLAVDLAYQERLQAAIQIGATAPDVDVNPRYGRAEVLDGGIAQVVPPDGPRPAPLAGV